MLNKHFQNAIYQFVGIVEFSFGIIDENGYVIASSVSIRGERKLEIDFDRFRDSSIIVENGITFKPVYNRSKFEFCVYVENTSELAKKYAQILAASFSNIKQFYEEKYDANSFIKTILLDSILPGDIYARTKELKLDYDMPRIVYLVSISDQDEGVIFEILYGMYPEKGKNFVINLDEKNIAVIMEAQELQTTKQIEAIATTIISTVRSEAMINISVGIGSRVMNLRDISVSYREAQAAVEIGNVFDGEKDILNYESLGIGRLIYQLPIKLCQMFIDEVFKKGSIEKLDQENILTIQRFFENSLNISETARKLFIHRNTLVYRLDKILKLTGLDLREFDDAIIFKVEMMVKKYLAANVMKI